MKYITTLVTLLLLLAGVALGQRINSGDFQKDVFNGALTMTLDSTTVDTFHIDLPLNRGKATFAGYLMLDDLDEDATHDSLLIQYRPGYANTARSVLYQADGTAGLTYKSLGIYQCGEVLDYFDNAITWVDSAVYMVVFDLDGYPWRSIDITFTQTANDCTTADDSTKVYFWIDVD